MESDKQKAADLGLAGYIVKPISVKGLLETLANCFNPPHAEK
jgi:AmiR/NasT family two-component response regulator